MNKEFPTVHMVIKNEDRFIWYVVTSILPFAESLFITDTGSSDDTEEIVRSINSPKIFFKKIIINNPGKITEIRQEQLSKTETDWFWIVDGDEIYSQKLASEIVGIMNIKKFNYKGIVVGRLDLLGDIYHKQSESVGSYHLFFRKGHIVIRLINRKKIEGLHLEGIYPYEGYYDGFGHEITKHPAKDFYFTRHKLYHAMYLNRSSSGEKLNNTYHRNKYKIELGQLIEKNDNYPEVFDTKRPHIVPDVRIKRSAGYELAANLITPVKMIKRRLFPV